MKNKKNRILFLALILAGVMICGWIVAGREPIKVEATEGDASADKKVKPVNVDYDALWLKVDANGNTKVYYSDKSQKIWYEAKSAETEIVDGKNKVYYNIDISWLSNTANSIIYLKGDDNDEIISVTFPPRNSKFKAKFDKARGVIVFDNLSDGINEFQWRKATSYDWNTASIANGESDSKFTEVVKQLRVSGATIYVRLPSTEAHEESASTDGVTTTKFNPGSRQSKEVKVTIPKLAAAPKVTIDGTKLLLNTKATMEYSLDNGINWESASVKMKISDIAEAAKKPVLYEYDETGKAKATTTSVNVLFHTKATEKKPASKSFLLTIPAQRPRPSCDYALNQSLNANEVTWWFDGSKFYLYFRTATKAEPFEYMIQKPNTTLDLTKGWKAVTSIKEISISSKMAPDGSKIYIRKKTIKANAKTHTSFEIASAYVVLEVIYPTSSSSSVSQ